MKKTFVLLNRILGNTTTRFNDSVIWELIVPIKNADGTFSTPKEMDKYFAAYAFVPCLLEGKTVLVNKAGGWNLLSSNDHILRIWQE